MPPPTPLPDSSGSACAITVAVSKQVPAAANRARLDAALAEGNNQSVTVRIYPEANHLFMPAVTGEPAEYATLPRVFVASLLEDITAWIAAR